MLKIRDLTVEIPGKKIIDKISFTIQEGDWLMIIGPNGAGKTTITNALAQSLESTGKILYKGKSLRNIKAKERAKIIGVLMQNHILTYPFTVSEVVELGLYAQKMDFITGINDEENKRVNNALEITDMKEKKDQSVMTLSGGELQRTFLSQLLVQNPKIMILDEPTNHLDISRQESIFNLVINWIRKGDRAVISVVHDLRLARMYGNKALLLKEGKVFDFGNIEKVMSSENLKKVYGIDVYLWQKRLNENWI